MVAISARAGARMNLHMKCAHDAAWSRGAKQALPASAGDAAATVKAAASVTTVTVTELTLRRSSPSA